MAGRRREYIDPQVFQPALFVSDITSSEQSTSVVSDGKTHELSKKELIALYRQELAQLLQSSADWEFDLVFRRVDDPDTTMTVHCGNPVVRGEYGPCWEVVTLGYSLPTLTTDAIRDLNEAYAEEKKTRNTQVRRPMVIQDKSRLVTR